jgi:hypothetical protein
MTEENSHRACVQRWMQTCKGSPPEQLVEAFDRAFGALWQRAHRTLGRVTLAAILGRALDTAAERFPVLASLRVEESAGLVCDGLRERATREGSGLEPALEFLLVEFLRLLGTLTAEILTPALHAVLSAQSQDAKGSES